MFPDKLTSDLHTDEELVLLQSIYKRIGDEDFEQKKREAIKNPPTGGPGPVGLMEAVRFFGLIGNVENFPIAKEPLEEMPLYVNDKDLPTKAVAIWRLQLGR